MRKRPAFFFLVTLACACVHKARALPHRRYDIEKAEKKPPETEPAWFQSKRGRYLQKKEDDKSTLAPTTENCVDEYIHERLALVARDCVDSASANYNIIYPDLSVGCMKQLCDGRIKCEEDEECGFNCYAPDVCGDQECRSNTLGTEWWHAHCAKTMTKECEKYGVSIKTKTYSGFSCKQI